MIYLLPHGQVAHGIDGGHLVLGGGHLVVLGGGGDAQLPQLLVQVGHEGAHPVPDDAEVLVLQFLPLGGGSKATDGSRFNAACGSKS